VGKSVLTRAPLATTLRGQGAGRIAEGRDPAARRKPLTARKINEVVSLTLNEKPPDAASLGRTHDGGAGWHRAVVVQAAPTKTFKLSRDPNLVAKVEDIVGLYLNPPDKALVLAVYEKSQIRTHRPHPAGAADKEGPLRDDDA
jgi:hypothetical protein